jgi:hypothetical protein
MKLVSFISRVVIHFLRVALKYNLVVDRDARAGSRSPLEVRVKQATVGVRVSEYIWKDSLSELSVMITTLSISGLYGVGSTGRLFSSRASK